MTLFDADGLLLAQHRPDPYYRCGHGGGLDVDFDDYYGDCGCGHRYDAFKPLVVCVGGGGCLRTVLKVCDKCSALDGVALADLVVGIVAPTYRLLSMDQLALGNTSLVNLVFGVTGADARRDARAL